MNVSTLPRERLDDPARIGKVVLSVGEHRLDGG
jgi:hypothetical protein